MAAPLIRKLVPPWLASLTPYQPGKPIEEVERELGISGAAKLASNENPLGPSPLALEAIRGALGGVHRYPDGGGVSLRRKIAGKLGVSPDEVILGNGSNELLELTVRAFLRPGERVVLSENAFVVYALVAQAAAGVPVVVPSRGGAHDLDAMVEAVGRRTRIVFLGNPNNPTGTIFRREELDRFLARIPPGVIVVSDEAYFEYVSDPEFPNTIEMRGERLLFTLRTFSKIYGLAGLRIGYGIGPAGFVEVLNRIRQPFNVSSIAQIAAEAAIDDSEHLDRSRRANAEGRDTLCRAFEALGLDWIPSEANFLLVRVGAGAAITEGLLHRGVIVRPMDGYGFPEHVRVTVGTPEENDCFVNALTKVLVRPGVKG